MRLRSHLILLVLATTLPLLIFATVIVLQDLDERREILDRGMQDTARALTVAIDGEVKASLEVLQALASSPLLDGEDLESFHRICARAMENRRGAYIILFDTSGVQLVNSSRAFGSPLPNPLQKAQPAGADSRYPDVPVGGDAPVRKVLETGRQFVSDLFISLLTGEPRIGLDVPVLRGGQLRYVLEMSLDAAEFARFLAAQRPSADPVLEIVDRRGIAIARTDNASSRVGTPLAQDFARQTDGLAQGSKVDRNAEGQSVYYVFARSRLTGWTTSLSVQEATAFAPLTKALTILGLGAAIAILVAVGAAVLVGRRISGPIAALSGAAQAMAHGEANAGSVSNVAELQQLQRALVTAGSAVRRASEERERAVVNHVLEGIITIDEGGKIVSFNPAAGRLFGYEPSEVLARNITLMMPEHHRREHQEGLSSYLQTGIAKVIGVGREVEGQRKDGSVFPMEIAVSEVRVGDKRWFTGIVRDITERKQAEMALKDASRAKDEFLAVLSHELRNPLAALTTASHLLGVVDANSREAADARGVVDRQTKHMTRLVSDLLDISRISLGKLALQWESVDLGEAVSNLASVWRASGRFERHHVVVSVQPAWVRGDRARIEQIAANLLDNALKFTPGGKTISIQVRSENGEAVLEVRDDGAGIAAKDRDRLFDLFTQGKISGRSSEGLGIGLALVRRLSDLHGGSASVASDGTGRGSLFQVRLPREPQPGKIGEPSAVRAATPRSILIVEDNEDARRTLHALLTMEGHDVRTAPDGSTGVALASAALPVLAFIDINLPDIDGYEVARQLRRMQTVRRMGLVAITGFGQQEDQRRAYEAGFDAHLVKPVSIARLQQVILDLT